MLRFGLRLLIDVMIVDKLDLWLVICIVFAERLNIELVIGLVIVKVRFMVHNSCCYCREVHIFSSLHLCQHSINNFG